MAELYSLAKDVRKMIMDQVLRTGTCPKVAVIAEAHSVTREKIVGVLKDLEAAVCVAVQDEKRATLECFQDEKLNAAMPEVGEIFYARPFASFENHYRISVDGEQKWYGECAVECCGISAMFPGKEVIVRSVCRQTKEPVKLIGRDGMLLEYSPKTLRVHFGFPLKLVPEDVLGWCDYNSFFSSEDAVNEWRQSHPKIKGATRDPLEVSRLVSLIGKGRLDYDYQVRIPILKLLLDMKRLGMTKPLPGIGLHIPDPFFMFTPGMLRRWKEKGYRNFIQFSLT
jgi:hypothetical protein